MFGDKIKHLEINQEFDSAINLWQSSNVFVTDEKQVENFRSDPVIQLLISALTHQSNTILEDIDRFQEDLIYEYARLTSPDYLLTATPSVAMLKTAPKAIKDNKSELPIVNDDVTFSASSTGMNVNERFSFSPMLQITLFPFEIISVQPNEEKKQGGWRVLVRCTVPITSLKGLSIYIPVVEGCCTISVDVNGIELDVCNLTDFDRLPFTSSLQAMMSTGNNVLSSLRCLYDRLCLSGGAFCIINDGYAFDSVAENDVICLNISLDGIDSDVSLSTESIIFNCLPVYNVEKHSCTLEDAIPLRRINLENTFFFSFLPPSDSDGEILLRRIATERFSPLVFEQRIKQLIHQYDIDYNYLKSSIDEKVWNEIELLFSSAKKVGRDNAKKDNVLYFVLRKKTNGIGKTFKQVNWLTTQGAIVNQLTIDSVISSSSYDVDDGKEKTEGINGDGISKTRFLTPPRGGRDDCFEKAVINEKMRYWQGTRDRIISRSDIVLFCRYKLTELFDIKEEDIVAVIIDDDYDEVHLGYYERIIKVKIKIKSYSGKISFIESTLAKMISSRSLSCIPIVIKVECVL